MVKFGLKKVTTSVLGKVSIGVVAYLYSCLSKGWGPKSTSNKQSVWVLIREGHVEERDRETN